MSVEVQSSAARGCDGIPETALDQRHKGFEVAPEGKNLRHKALGGTAAQLERSLHRAKFDNCAVPSVLFIYLTIIFLSLLLLSVIRLNLRDSSSLS